jgi:hypothetical protein
MYLYLLSIHMGCKKLGMTRSERRRSQQEERRETKRITREKVRVTICTTIAELSTK